jgi:anti-sigma regulatory factor (Ser/Thr protein kinase)
VFRCEYTWPARAEHVSDARARVAELACRAGAPTEVMDDIRLAVSEAVGNAIRHGYRGDPSGEVTVMAEARDARLKIVVSDEGCGMRARTDDPGAGLGLPLIASSAQTMSVNPGPGGRGTELCMTFPLDQAAA